MKNKKSQIITAVILVIILVLLSDPFMFWMPDEFLSMVLILAAVLLGVWVALIAQEKAGDEREALHRMEAGRVAYILGLVSLSLALVVQGFQHNIDVWVLVSLGVMVVARLGARLYVDIHR